MGRDSNDRWWALLGWVGNLRYDFREYVAVCSGWIPADDVARRLDGADYSAVAKVRLGPEPSTWLRPWLATDLHYAPMTRQTPPEPPEGAQWDGTPAYRRRKPHYELASGWERRRPPTRRQQP